METLIVIALTCAAISFTITTTSIFAWFRDIVSKIHPKIEELIHCPWCLNHYVVLGVLPTAIKKLQIEDINSVYNFIIFWFATVCIGGLIHYVLLRAYEPVAKTMLQRKINKQNAEN